MMQPIALGGVRRGVSFGPPPLTPSRPYWSSTTPIRWSGRPYIALAPSDSAVRRFGSAGEGSL
eukprot:3609302-Prymnesium_polylepis.1